MHSTAAPTGRSQYVNGNPNATGTTIALKSDAGAAVQPFAVNGPADPGAGAVYVTVSGESNALTGYPYPPGDWTNDTYLVDGWQFTIEEYLVAIDHVTMWASPNVSLTQQSIHGPQVAHLDGPFVVDLHKGGAILGQGGAPEQATAIGVIAEPERQRRRVLRSFGDVRLRLQHRRGDVRRVQREPHRRRSGRLRRDGAKWVQRDVRRPRRVGRRQVTVRLHADERRGRVERGRIERRRGGPAMQATRGEATPGPRATRRTTSRSSRRR